MECERAGGTIFFDLDVRPTTPKAPSLPPFFGLMPINLFRDLKGIRADNKCLLQASATQSGLLEKKTCPNRNARCMMRYARAWQSDTCTYCRLFLFPGLACRHSTIHSKKNPATPFFVNEHVTHTYTVSLEGQKQTTLLFAKPCFFNGTRE